MPSNHNVVGCAAIKLVGIASRRRASGVDGVKTCLRGGEEVEEEEEADLLSASLSKLPVVSG